MDGEVRVNKNKGGSADHAKGHDEISHGQEMVSGEVHKERGGDEEVHEARESDKRACRARAGCNGVHKVKESGNKMKESGTKAKESSNEAQERRVMVDGNDKHVKMVSGNGKAGKDEANEGGEECETKEERAERGVGQGKQMSKTYEGAALPSRT